MVQGRSRIKWLILLLAVLLLAGCVWGMPGREFGVSGRVVDQQGNPLEDVEVLAQGRSSRHTRTNSAGYYELSGLRGPHDIRPVKLGWSFTPPVYERVRADRDDLDFVGEQLPTAVLTGTIRVEHSFPRSVVDAAQSLIPSRPRPAAAASWPGEEDGDSDELIIAFEEGVSEDEQLQLLRDWGYLILDRLTLLNAYLVEPMAPAEQGLLQALSFPGLKYAAPNRPVSPLWTVQPNDPYYPGQWHYPLIRLPQAWSVTTGDRRIRIAVVDSGVQPDHPDLAGRLDHEYGFNFVQNNRDFSDDSGHGTHVAGTIGALTDNGLGVAGVMWEVELLPIKVLDGMAGGDWELSQGLLYAAGLLKQDDKPFNPYPAQVINLSLGGRRELPNTREAINRILAETDCILVAAAGNDRGPMRYPALYSGVIAVGAVDYNYPHKPRRAPYSSYGPELFVMAPGGDLTVDSDFSGSTDGVLSTFIANGGYTYMEGTSMATPHVSGVIGLMLAAGIPPQRIPQALQETAMPLGEQEFSPEYGYGLINAYWAVNEVTTMRLVVGTRRGSKVDVVAEASLPAKGGYFQVTDIPPGEYQVMAWVDVRPGPDELEPGDYFNESAPITLEAGRHYTVSGTIFELDRTLAPPGESLVVVASEAGTP
ncbi:MAG TPA: S8 family serine peptidase [Limnochordia bacterium]|nr:S8 family serine peptidase [Limnochordia bacterium]